MRTTALVAIAAVFVLTLPASAERARQMLSIYVRPPATVDGFTEPSKHVGDSTEDLAKHVASGSRKSIRPATSQAGANIVTEVVERHMEEDGDLHVVTVRLRVGNYERTLTGRAGTGWANAALDVARQIDTWANDNRDRILAQRATQ